MRGDRWELGKEKEESHRNCTISSCFPPHIRAKSEEYVCTGMQERVFPGLFMRMVMMCKGKQRFCARALMQYYYISAAEDENHVGMFEG